MMYNRPAASQPLSTPRPVARGDAQFTTRDITHVEMTAALSSGQARTLSRTITDFVKLRNHWWIYDRDGWIRIDDPALCADLDAAALLMGASETPTSPLEDSV